MEENSGSARIFSVRKYFFNTSLCVACVRAARVCVGGPGHRAAFKTPPPLPHLTHLRIAGNLHTERLDTLLLLFMVIFIYRGTIGVNDTLCILLATVGISLAGMSSRYNKSLRMAPLHEHKI